MNRIIDFIVKKKYSIMVIYVILTCICAFLITKVNINTDMTKYLSDESTMKQGLDLMQEELPAAMASMNSSTLRVMFTDLPEDRKEEVKETLEGLEYVDSVSYLKDDSDYNKENYTLYVLSVPYKNETKEETAVENAIRRTFAGDQVIVENSEARVGLPFYILCLALTLLFAVLFVMCNSWFEPVIFLIVIGIAVVLNMGTNIFKGTVSNTTYSIAAVLQLILSMDYSIILINRYRQELPASANCEQAMSKALKNAFSSVTSSAFTTFVGLLMLVFMKFKIGADLGIVLAKGVLFSLLCVFTLLPGLILHFHKLIEKTAKPAPKLRLKRMADFSYRFRLPLLCLFVVLLAASYWYQQKTEISFDLSAQSTISETFPDTNSVVLLYDNEDEAEVTKLADSLSDNSRIKSVVSYPILFEKEYTAEQLSEKITSLTTQISLPSQLLRFLYYDYYHQGEVPKVSTIKLLKFISQQKNENAALISQAKEAALQMGIDTSAFSLDENALNLLRIYYGSVYDYDESWTLSLTEMIRFIKEDLVSQSAVAAFMTSDMTDKLSVIDEYTDQIRNQMEGSSHSLLMLSTTYPKESEETFDFLNGLAEKCDEVCKGSYYMIGTSAMYREMQQTFRGELSYMTILTTAAIFIIVLFTFRSLLVPVFLVLLVLCGVYITVSVSGIRGVSINYLALIIVQCILMGSIIDYGILMSNYYRENRKTETIQESIRRTYEGSIHTILTSGLIMVLVTGVIGLFVDNPTIAPICLTISIGSLVTIILIILLLPGMLGACDRFVKK